MVQYHHASIAPPTEQYTYPGYYLTYILVVSAVLIAIALTVASIVMYLKDGDWKGISIGVIFIFITISGFKLFFTTKRPLRLNEEGVAAVAFGKPWKFIAWSDVQKIVRMRKQLIGQLGYRYGYIVWIIGKDEKIQLDDFIIRSYPRPLEKYPALTNHLNYYIAKYSIPLKAYDQGVDTMDNVRATVKDPIERKKLLKEGVPSVITSL